MFEQTQWVWMDGRMLPWHEATVHVSVHALHYGTGVFEGIRCYETDRGPAVFRLDAHLDRFYASAAVYGLQIPFSKVDLAQGIRAVIRRNGFQSCYIRPIGYYGSDNLGLIPDKCPVRVSILAWPWDPLHGKQALESGVRVVVSRWLKFHSQMMPTTAKACGQYLNSVLAIREAASGRYDDALLLDVYGNVCEGSGENVFVVKNRTLLTNDSRHSILLGVTRDTVMTIARDLGFEVETRVLQLRDLLSADEAFLTGTAAEITPIRSVDDQPIGQGLRGPITEAIQRTFFSITKGCLPAYQDWLNPIANHTGSQISSCKDGAVG
jgi:branched-chain amino acid aminotransferase